MIAFMVCPACSGALAPLTAAGVTVDVCAACGGVWLDPGELQALPGAHAALLSGRLTGAGNRPVPGPCPRCLVALDARTLNDVVIDQCPRCHGLWCDAGELAAVRRASGRGDPARTLPALQRVAQELVDRPA
jgi:Zn-finger nucleic acid-binding protein